MIRLQLLGGVSIRRGDQPLQGPVTQRRRLALLALLSFPAGRALSRDKLIGYLWPESGTEQARHLLSEALYVLRKALGEGVVLAAADEIHVASGALGTDAAEFEAALAAADLERALELYRGSFLDGFFVADAPEFERWAEAERVRLASAHQRALEAFARQREAKGDLESAVDAWRKLVQADPFNGRFALQLMQALAAAGDRAAALQHARVHAALLREEFRAQPDPEVAAFAERLRAEPEAARMPTAPPVPPPVGAAPLPANAPAPPQEAASAAGVAVAASQPPPAATPRAAGMGRLVIAASVVSLVAVGLFVGLRSAASRNAPADPPIAGVLEAAAPSIAVLPFVDLGPAREHDWLGEGIAEQLISSLARLAGVKVAARTSAFAFRDAAPDIRDIGKRLGVGLILEGSVRLTDDRLRVSAQLVSAETGYQIWAETYAVAVGDIYDVQDDIARSIVGSLHPRLAAAPARSAPPTADPQAYSWYLQGRYFWNRRTPEGLERAIALFERAVARDPSFALAHAGLADSYAVLVTIGALPPAVGYSRAREAAEAALRIDPSLAEAHAALALVKLYQDRDWQAAEREFRRALELSPGYATGRQWFAQFLAYRGDTTSALREIRVAQELDPLSLPIQTAAGTLLYYARRFDEANDQFRRIIEMDPTFWMARLQLGASYLQQGRLADAELEAAEVMRLAGDHPLALALLGYLHGTAGRRDQAQHVLAQLEAEASRRYLSPAYLAAVQLSIGEVDAAFASLEQADLVRDDWMIFLGVEPVFDPLRGDRRFAQLLARAKN